MRCYVDSSAAAKLMILEPESGAFQTWCDRDDVELIGSDLVETEMRRLAERRDISQTTATAVLDGFELHEVTRGILLEAGLLPGRTLRSLDAIHLASALNLSATTFATYDRRLAEAAQAVGLAVVAPT